MAIFQNGINIGRIDWVKSVGNKVRFIYNNIEGIIKIENYIYPNVTFSYLNIIATLHISQFRKCQLGSFLNIYTKTYFYNIGDIINNNIILEQIRVKQGKCTSKGYKYKCLKDGYIGTTTEVAMKILNCPVCSNYKVLKGINDIATTNPEIVKYFTNIEDVYTHTYSSGKIVNLHCIDCGLKKEVKISTFYKYGIQCSRCSDGQPYPEKFMFNLLEQLNINFEIHKVFHWSKNVKNSIQKLSGKKIYDFYIPLFNTIIEVMGNQHFKKAFEYCGGRTLYEEQENDIIKEQLAQDNGIKNYIIIDARISNMKYMKNSILNSKLLSICNLNNINWLKCELFALNTRVKEACNLWNNGMENTLNISKLMKLSNSTIWIYLNKGKELGWCKYNANWFLKESSERLKNIRSKRVEIFQDNISLGVFKSVSELSKQSKEKYNIQLLQSKISLVCNNHRKHHKGFTFKYL